MQSFLYKKETFIYEKKNSITHELCKDIIEIFETDRIINDCNCYNIDCNTNYNKIKSYLTKELGKNLNNYNKKIDKIKNYNMIEKKIKNCDKKIAFYIEKNKSTYNFNYINRVSIGSTDIKLLMYIWVLNDYDGEIIFWNEYKIIPKAGSFIMFPISWCFPYEELIDLQNDKYIIYGYIYV
jgi:hypothetical protein